MDVYFHGNYVCERSMKVAGSTRSAVIFIRKHKHLHTHALQGENLGQPSEVAKSEKENVNKQAIKFFLLPLDDDDDLHKQTFDASTHTSSSCYLVYMRFP
jgi:hypothetical protein